MPSFLLFLIRIGQTAATKGAGQLTKLIASSPEVKTALKILRSRKGGMYRDLTQTVKRYKLNPQEARKDLINSLYTDPKKLEKQLVQMSRKGRKISAADIQEIQEQEQVLDSEGPLNSSWLSYGKFEKIGASGTGNLILTLKSGRSYTYFGVPEVVWQAMLSAGAHAGTIFWHSYLRSAKTTISYKQVAQVYQLGKLNYGPDFVAQKLGNITRGSIL